MIWHRLDRDKTLDMIGRVKTAPEAMLFTPVTSEAKCSRLPFFKTFLLYRLTNFSSLPTFSMDFLSNGETFLYMDGSNSAMRHLADMGELVINEETIVPYINFYYCYVRQPEGEMLILKEPGEASQIDMYDEERREDFDVRPAELEIGRVTENGSFRVIAPLLYDDAPMEAIIVVTLDGQVMTSPKRMLTF